AEIPALYCLARRSRLLIPGVCRYETGRGGRAGARLRFPDGRLDHREYVSRQAFAALARVAAVPRYGCRAPLAHWERQPRVLLDRPLAGLHRHVAAPLRSSHAPMD